MSPPSTQEARLNKSGFLRWGVYLVVSLVYLMRLPLTKILYINIQAYLLCMTLRAKNITPLFILS